MESPLWGGLVSLSFITHLSILFFCLRLGFKRTVTLLLLGLFLLHVLVFLVGLFALLVLLVMFLVLLLVLFMLLVLLLLFPALILALWLKLAFIAITVFIVLLIVVIKLSVGNEAII